ncbi:MAG TPA: MotA/TolQ/ExbB proton channel family protein [Armatimonadota bacterium]|nr:MotA/TolQ/ExbB proton channel family protein [Armatimonadota bacterium]
MWQLFERAGMVAYPLGACSVLALAIILERFFTFWRLKAAEDRASMILLLALEKRDDSLIRDPKIAGAPSTQIMSALSELRGASEDSIHQAAGIALSMQRLRLRRYLGTLATIGSTAPFIGLFGTVVGIMRAFADMGAGSGGPDSAMLMRGISEALSATALGLLVAVPSVVAYNYFVGRVQAMLLQVQSHVARLAPMLRASSRDLEKV